MNNLFGVKVIKTDENLFEDVLHVSDDEFLHSYNGIVDFFSIDRLKDKVDKFSVDEVLVNFNDGRIIHFLKDIDFSHGFLLGGYVACNDLNNS